MQTTSKKLWEAYRNLLKGDVSMIMKKVIEPFLYQNLSKRFLTTGTSRQLGWKFYLSQAGSRVWKPGVLGEIIRQLIEANFEVEMFDKDGVKTNEQSSAFSLKITSYES